MTNIMITSTHSPGLDHDLVGILGKLWGFFSGFLLGGFFGLFREGLGLRAEG